MRKFLATLVATTLLAVPAYADDWTGGYAGLGVGWADVDGTGGLSGDDVAYGLFIGYNQDLGDWVFGGELEYAWVDIDVGAGAQVDNISRLKLRAGYDFGEAIGYVAVGGARADTTVGSDTGAVYGLGIDYAASEFVTISGEWLRHDFNNFNSTGVDIDANSFTLRAAWRF